MLEYENRQKAHSKVTKKMKSKAMVIILGESLDYKSGDVFFVPSLEVPFFSPSIWPFLPKVPELGPQKRHFQCQYKKSETTFIIQTFPKNVDCSL